MGQQQPFAQHVCCSMREKYDTYNNGFSPTGPPQFLTGEVHIGVESPRFLAFAPLWQRDNSPPRRLALAGRHEVHVYLVSETEIHEDPTTTSNAGGETSLQLRLEHSMELDADMEVTAMIFSDDSSSKTLVIAASPISDAARRTHQVRFFSCDSQASQNGTNLDDGELPVNVWTWDDSHASALEEHGAPVTHLVTSQTMLVTADRSGTCGTWQKNKGFSKRHTSRKLHKGSIADLSVDRFFVYTCGREDKMISVWSVPDLQPIMETFAEIPRDLFFNKSSGSVVPAQRVADGSPDISAPRAVGASQAKAKSDAYQLSELTALRRPLSRWAGSQGSTRSAKAPKGTLFVAAVLADDCEAAGVGAGVLMEWAMAATGDARAICQSAQVAHDSPIISIAYGPYDNGPVITADMRGVFRVWDCVPRLTLSQHLEFFSAPQATPHLTMVVEPQRGLYTCTGDRRLFVWRRSNSQEFVLNNAA